MIEAVMFWNEPNNKSHWDFEIDRDWSAYARMVKLASAAVRAENPYLWQSLGGISPIDVEFIRNMQSQGVLDFLDIVALHGFPLDWNHWQIDEWPGKLAEIGAVTDLQVWVSEVGVSSFGAEEVQAWGLARTAELLLGNAPRIHWYSLYDLPRAWPATTRHREAEGSSYYRHFYMGLLREDGTTKPALERFAELTPGLGICQWFHFEDPRLADATGWLRRLGVRYLRTGLSWADWLRPQAERWFDRQMNLLSDFDITLTFCFTPEQLGISPHHTSPPVDPARYADFCAEMVRRYAPAGALPLAAHATPQSDRSATVFPPAEERLGAANGGSTAESGAPPPALPPANAGGNGLTKRSAA
jgi:beta-xylosidase